MRLVIDLQGAQGSSYARGIGRYSRELALAMATAPRGHEVIIALNGALAAPAAELAARFAEILPRRQISVWHPPGESAAINASPLRKLAESLRAQCLSALNPDLVHVTSLFEGLGDDVVTLLPPHLARLPVVATCYDLIPLVRHHDYFGERGRLSPAARWYYRCAHEMAMSEGLLAISDSSRGEAIRHLAFDARKVFDIQSGISPDFRPALLSAADRAALLQRYGLRGAFILFLGAGDLRKNEAGLIAAYALLPPALRAGHQLLIVGRMAPSQLYETARRLGVPEDEFVIVPFVPEADLNALYSACALFVFPSLHEGFGLPVAEAMACGAPVIASNTTSLPEVIGRADATFDPADPASIAGCMQRVLENPDFRAELAQWGPVRAARFTWPASAARAWDALEAIAAQLPARDRPRPAGFLAVRPRLAFVSPLPPQASGISDYSRDLVFALARHYDITLVSEAELADERLAAGFPLLRPDAFLAQASGFARILYQIGNSVFHRFQIEDLLPHHPGVVTLHDVFLSDYANWLAHAQGDPDRFRAALLQSHGYPALRVEAKQGREAAILDYPCSLPVLQGAIGIIQHSRHANAILERFFGRPAGGTPALIAHLRAARPQGDRAAARAALGLEADVFLLCSFGGVHRAKCPGFIADAWRRTGLPGRLVFVGEAGPELALTLPDAQAGIACTGRVDLDHYDLWLAAADLAVQWRSFSRGESSGAIADVLIAGLPLIVNRHGSAAELPEDVVLGLADAAGVDALAAAILALQGDPARRRTLAAAGRGYALRALAPEAIALRYRDAIEHAYAQPLALTAAGRFGPEIRAAATLPGGLAALAKSLSRSFAAPWRSGGQPRLLVDLSGPAGGAPAEIRDGWLELARRVLESPPPPYRGAAIRIEGGLIRECFAEPLALLGHPPLDLPETPLDAGAGDILLCNGLTAGLTAAAIVELGRLQLDGLRIILIVHHLPPPDGAWAAGMPAIADGAACVSAEVAEGLAAWLNADPARRRTKLPIGVFPLGADPAVALDAGHWDESFRWLCGLMTSACWPLTWSPG